MFLEILNERKITIHAGAGFEPASSRILFGDAGSNPAADMKFFFHFKDVCLEPDF